MEEDKRARKKERDAEREAELASEVAPEVASEVAPEVASESAARAASGESSGASSADETRRRVSRQAGLVSVRDHLDDYIEAHPPQDSPELCYEAWISDLHPEVGSLFMQALVQALTALLQVNDTLR